MRGRGIDAEQPPEGGGEDGHIQPARCRRRVRVEQRRDGRDTRREHGRQATGVDAHPLCVPRLGHGLHERFGGGASIDAEERRGGRQERLSCGLAADQAMGRPGGDLGRGEVEQQGHDRGRLRPFAVVRQSGLVPVVAVGDRDRRARRASQQSPGRRSPHGVVHPHDPQAMLDLIVVDHQGVRRRGHHGVEGRPGGRPGGAVQPDDGAEVGPRRAQQGQAVGPRATQRPFVRPDRPAHAERLQAHAGQEAPLRLRCPARCRPALLVRVDGRAVVADQQALRLPRVERRRRTSVAAIRRLAGQGPRQIQAHRVVGVPVGQAIGLRRADDVVGRADQVGQLTRGGRVAPSSERGDGGHGRILPEALRPCRGG